MSTGPALTVALVGQPFWTVRLAESVARQSRRLSVVDLAGDGARAVARLHGGIDPERTTAVRVGYRPGAPTVRGRGYDALWRVVRRVRPRLRTGYFWIGTDVSDAVADHRAGRLTRSYALARERSAHCAGAPWLCAELATTGVDATYVPFPVYVPSVPIPPPFPDRFTVLTYIPNDRPHLYGGDCLLATAAALPDVLFVVAGGDGTWTSAAPGNVTFVGRLPSLVSAMTASHVVLRLVRHDGFGATIREALALGRHALYSYDVPGTIQVDPDHTASVVQPLRRLRDEHERGRLQPNEEGRRYVTDEIDERSSVEHFERWVGKLSGATR